MCPKSSLSISSDGMAAQFTSTKAAYRRDEVEEDFVHRALKCDGAVSDAHW
jgi:hypothetical protein